MENEKEIPTSICKDIPNLLSSFVDTFVDFSVSGLFLPPPPPPSTPPTRLPSPKRLIAIGDLHGDLNKSKQALRLAGLIDSSDNYTGGSATVVQVGDVLDRGDNELKILYFLEKLKRQAARCGGSFVTMNGNHEIMNIEGDFRYVTEGGVEEFRVWLEWFREGNKMKSLCQGLKPLKDPLEGIEVEFRGANKKFHEGFRARVAALRPNGPISRRFFTDNVTVLVVGESIFVHGGLLPDHVYYGLENINAEVSDWIRGSTGRFSPPYCRGRNAVVWLRKFSDEVAVNCDCSTLEHVLSTIPGVKRMIMGHTIQMNGINAVCDNKAIRIDVGMSDGCGGGLPEVLEINETFGVRILTSNPLYQNKESAFGIDVGKKEEGLGLLLTEQGGPRQVKVKA
ncbi:shewanella-like protein phosphatase 2 [Vicia villosa]|uniref:shewanella-like protein phosphatase 2 n=1 Tax=Vicia villosa TaxID=3911 RepID=UPI00273CA763|nr:shewanella-like protein phosphatase 2 [Vicia villosa]